MPSMEKLTAFARKWIEKFQDEKSTAEELAGPDLAEDCRSLGFFMDSGKSFAKRFGGPFPQRPEILEKLIADEGSIQLLGTAVYSRWRYFNHWAYDPREILETDNRACFVILFKKLASLAKENKSVSPFYYGRIRKFRLETNTICFGPVPEPDDEVEQHLTVTEDGRVYFSSYDYGDGKKYRRTDTNNFRVSVKTARQVLDLFAQFFSFHDEDFFATDVGTWGLLMENEEGEKFPVMGSVLSGYVTDDGVDISKRVRQLLGMDNLFVLDGNPWDQIEKVELTYQESRKDSPDFAEHLIVDREKETVYYDREIGDDPVCSEKFHLAGQISAFLDKQDTDSLFLYYTEPVQKTDPVWRQTHTYTLTVTCHKKKPYQLSGSFDRRGLPMDYPAFIESLRQMLDKAGDAGALFNPGFYGKELPKKGEVIVCSIAFAGSKKTYAYLTEDPDLNVGDRVFIPVGPDNARETGTIVKIDCCLPEKAAYPVKQMKTILGRCPD